MRRGGGILTEKLLDATDYEKTEHSLMSEFSFKCKS